MDRKEIERRIGEVIQQLARDGADIGDVAFVMQVLTEEAVRLNNSQHDPLEWLIRNHATFNG